MRKKVDFYSLVFTEKYYINGIDVLDEKNVTFIKNIDIDMQLNAPFTLINDAKLFYVNDLDIKIVISNVKDYLIICLYNYNDHKKLNGKREHYYSKIDNKVNNINLAISKIKLLKEDNVLYSSDYVIRAVIKESNGSVSLKYQELEIDDTFYSHSYDEMSADNFWYWVDIENISYLESKEDAVKEAKLYFDHLEKEDEEAKIVHEKSEKYLYSYNLSRFRTWVYRMKFFVMGILLFPVIFTIFALFKMIKWDYVIAFYICALFGIICVGVSLWISGGFNSYDVTENGIETFKGMKVSCLFSNIESIKVKKSIFSKRRGDIKFKLKKGASWRYNFVDVENVDKVYNVIKEALGKA